MNGAHLDQDDIQDELNGLPFGDYFGCLIPVILKNMALAWPTFSPTNPYPASFKAMV